MKTWPVVPGVPAAGHVTASGYWHPGAASNCPRCFVNAISASAGR